MGASISEKEEQDEAISLNFYTKHVDAEVYKVNQENVRDDSE
jgi:hypothetical protein